MFEVSKRVQLFLRSPLVKEGMWWDLHLNRQPLEFLLDRQQLPVGFCTFESWLLISEDNCSGNIFHRKVAGFSWHCVSLGFSVSRAGAPITDSLPELLTELGFILLCITEEPSCFNKILMTNQTPSFTILIFITFALFLAVYVLGLYLSYCVVWIIESFRLEKTLRSHQGCVEGIVHFKQH